MSSIILSSYFRTTFCFRTTKMTTQGALLLAKQLKGKSVLRGSVGDGDAYKHAETCINVNWYRYSCWIMSFDAIIIEFDLNFVSYTCKGLWLELTKRPIEGFSAGLVDDSDMFKWQVCIIFILWDVIYRCVCLALVKLHTKVWWWWWCTRYWYLGGCFIATMDFPPDYPINPPKMRFVSEMWHPNSTYNLAIIVTMQYTRTAMSVYQYYTLLVMMNTVMRAAPRDGDLWIPYVMMVMVMSRHVHVRLLIRLNLSLYPCRVCYHART